MYQDLIAANILLSNIHTVVCPLHNSNKGLALCAISCIGLCPKNISKMPTPPKKPQLKSPNPSNPPSRTNSIKKPSSKQKVEVEAIKKSLPSNPPSRTNSLKGKPSKLNPTNSIKVNSFQLFVRV